MLDLNHSYLCPFCGSISLLHQYLKKRKNGEYQTRIVNCPICKENMKLETLIADMSLFEWGLWLYLNIRIFKNPHNNFYDRVHFTLIFENLKMMDGDSKYKTHKSSFLKGYYHTRNNKLNNYTELLDELNKKYNIVVDTKNIKVKHINDFFT